MLPVPFDIPETETLGLTDQLNEVFRMFEVSCAFTAVLLHKVSSVKLIDKTGNGYT